MKKLLYHLINRVEELKNLNKEYFKCYKSF